MLFLPPKYVAGEGPAMPNATNHGVQLNDRYRPLAATGMMTPGVSNQTNALRTPRTPAQNADMTNGGKPMGHAIGIMCSPGG